MEQYFPIILAVCVALLAFAIAKVVTNLVKDDKRKLAERLSGTTGSTGVFSPRAAATQITLHTDAEGVPAEGVARSRGVASASAVARSTIATSSAEVAAG